MCAAIVALCVCGAGLFPAQPVAGKETMPAGLQGAAALDQLKRDGQYDSLQAAMNQAYKTETKDGEAAYPLTINPIFSLQQKLLAADGATGDIFGSSVALSGNTAVIGAMRDDVTQQDQGSVYVFVRNGAAWTLQQKITASDGAAGDYFGLAVALSGDTLVVGSPLDNIGAKFDQGSVYVFTRSGAVWTQKQKIINSEGAAFDSFGVAVALSDDTLMVSASGADIGPNADQGLVYVFMRNGAEWTQVQKFTASDGGANDFFGDVIALSGETIVVGQKYDVIGANFNQGSAYVFMRIGGFWTEQQKLTASDGAANDFFGAAVALKDETLVVGAFGADIGANNNQGSVYIFLRNGAVWTEQQKLTAGDGGAADVFGWAVATNGPDVVVGAVGDAIGGNAWQGSVYVFTRNGAVWTERQKITAGDGAAEDSLGVPLALSDDTLLAGAQGDNIGANLNQGSAYIFTIATCSQLMLDPQTLPNGVMGVPYSETLTATGGSEPYTFVAQAGLPPGLSLNANGLLSGTPTEDGNFNIRLRIVDANGCSSGADISITIEK